MIPPRRRLGFRQDESPDQGSKDWRAPTTQLASVPGLIGCGLQLEASCPISAATAAPRPSSYAAAARAAVGSVPNDTRRPDSTASACRAPPELARVVGERGDTDGCCGCGALVVSAVGAGLGSGVGPAGQNDLKAGPSSGGRTYRRQTTELIRALEGLLGTIKGRSRRGGGGARGGGNWSRNVVLREAVELAKTLLRDEQVRC
jgi:hypothetical protein